MTICVLGHSNPDTDSVMSALGLAAFLNAQGKDAQAFMQITYEKLNPETKMILEKFGLTVPAYLPDASGKTLALVDFNDQAQAPENIDKSEIITIVDHHKIGDIATPNPIYFRCEPVGCTGTVLCKMFKENGIRMTPPVASGILAAILSDTVNFKSPTCTDEDVKAVNELKTISEIDDTDALFMEMLKAKSSVAGIPAKDLLFRDFKDFDMNGKKVGVGQLELATLDQVADIRGALLDAMKDVKADGRHSVLLMLTDVIKEGSDLMVVSDAPDTIEAAFDKKIEGVSMWIDGMMSRKKQTIPNLQKAFGC